MSILALLESFNGRTREMPVPLTQDGYRDLSSPDWASSSVVLSNLAISGGQLRSTQVRPRFVNSRFEGCLFEDLRIDNALFGAGDEWQGCKFIQVSISRPTITRNRFVFCHVQNSTWAGARANETVFESCVFVGTSFVGFSVVAGKRARFIRCRFESVSFEQCRFRGVAFEECTFESPVVQSCDFEGATGKPQWWRPEQSTDAFLGWLDELLRFVGGRLGTHSAAYVELSRYRDQYASGAVADRDFAARLYDRTRVPYEEAAQLEEGIGELLKRANW